MALRPGQVGGGAEGNPRVPVRGQPLPNELKSIQERGLAALTAGREGSTNSLSQS